MMSYKRTEKGYLVLGGLASGLLVILALAFQQEATGYRLETNLPLLAALLVVGLSAALWGTLTVSVDANQLTLCVGFGWMRRSLPVSQIESCRIAKRRWRGAASIRKSPRSLLYNVYGLRALEITLSDGRTLLLGTDEPVRLLHAIAAASPPLTARARA